MCKICKIVHNVHPESFTLNIQLENLIENIEYLRMGDEYESAKERFEEFTTYFERLTEIRDDAELFVHEKISEIKLKVDLRREKLKTKIDEEALKLIDELNEYEKECREKINNLEKSKLESKLKQWEDDMESWSKQLACFHKDVDTWKKIDSECSSKLVGFSLV